jgi:hypothetical protein
MYNTTNFTSVAMMPKGVLTEGVLQLLFDQRVIWLPPREEVERDLKALPDSVTLH